MSALLYLFLFFVLSAAISPSHAVVAVTTAAICVTMWRWDNEGLKDEGALFYGTGVLAYFFLGIAAVRSHYFLIPTWALVLLPGIVGYVRGRKFSAFLIPGILVAIRSLQYGVIVFASSFSWPWLMAGAGGCIVIIILIQLGDYLIVERAKRRERERQQRIQEENGRLWGEQQERQRAIKEEERKKGEEEEAREEERRRQGKAEFERVLQETLATPEGRSTLARCLVGLERPPKKMDLNRAKSSLLATTEGREALDSAFRDAEGSEESLRHLARLWRKRSLASVQRWIVHACTLVRNGDDPFDYLHFRGEPGKR